MHSVTVLRVLRDAGKPLSLREAAEKLRDELVKKRSGVFATFDLMIFETMIIECEYSGEVIIDHDLKTVTLSPEWRDS